MLVLSRKRNEVIVIEVPGFDPIEITTVEIRGDKVRLGFEAPRDAAIIRKELRGKLKRREPKASEQLAGAGAG